MLQKTSSDRNFNMDAMHDTKPVHKYINFQLYATAVSDRCLKMVHLRTFCCIAPSCQEVLVNGANSIKCCILPSVNDLSSAFDFARRSTIVSVRQRKETNTGNFNVTILLISHVLTSRSLSMESRFKHER